MNIGKATAVFFDLESEKYSDEEKALAIYYPKEIKKLKRGLVNGKFID